MVEFVCMFVVQDMSDMTIKYTPKEMEGVYYPTNCAEDINILVNIANNDEHNENIKYIDVFGIYKDDDMIYWEANNG